MALKKQGVPAEFVRYPRSNHDLSRSGEPWLLVDRLEPHSPVVRLLAQGKAG